MSCRAAQQERDDNPEQGIWYYHSHGSVPRQRVPAVDYFYGDVFITGWLLYAVGELCFVQFRTMDMPQYGGYSNYQVFCIFREHLRPPEERPPRCKEARAGGADRAGGFAERLASSREGAKRIFCSSSGGGAAS
jgi:hypothetical protein